MGVGVQHILDSISGPAYARNVRGGVVATNQLARAQFADIYGRASPGRVAHLGDGNETSEQRQEQHRCHDVIPRRSVLPTRPRPEACRCGEPPRAHPTLIPGPDAHLAEVDVGPAEIRPDRTGTL